MAAGDNVLRRIIQLVLDHTSAKKAVDDMDGHAKHVERSWKETALHIAEAFGVVFALEKLREFGKESVKVASESQAVWDDLAVSIDNVGGSFSDLEDQLHATAQAFQDATGKSEDTFAKSLARLVTLTGDVDASMNNMGLVANVAAKFFRGDLEPATQLVAKAMNGNVAALQRMGIHARDGQQALEILASRSMGAAEARAKTFAGQTEALSTAWEEFQKKLGLAIIEGDGATDTFGALRAAIATLTQWVEENRGEIQRWVTGGIRFAIDATDVLIRAIQLTAYTITSVFQTAIGVGAQALGRLAQAYATVLEASVAYRMMTGKFVSQYDFDQTAKIQKQADAIVDWGKAVTAAGDASYLAAKKALTVPLFSSDQFKTAPKPGALPGETNAPMVGKNESSTATKEVEKAILEFNKAALAAANMERLLGKEFDATSAEIERSKKLLDVLVGNGIDPATKGFDGLQGRLKLLMDVVKPMNDATTAFSKTLGTDVAIAAITAGTGLETATTKLDLLKEKQAAVVTALKTFTTEASRNTTAFKDFARQYTELAVQIFDETKIQGAITGNREYAKSIKEVLATGALTGATAVAQLKDELSLALQRVQAFQKLGLSPLAPAMIQAAADFKELNTAVIEAEHIQKTAEAFREFGDVLRQDLFVATAQGASALDKLVIEQKALETIMKKISSGAIKTTDAELQNLRNRYRDVTAAIKDQTIAMQIQAGVADFLAQALGDALQGGLGKAAKARAKADAIEAAEYLVRAGAFALFGNFGMAAESLHLAEGFGALALAWGALGAAVGGGGGGDTVPIPGAVSGSASAGSGGQDLTQSRTGTSATASASQTPSAEVSIYLVGPGFSAVNPKVQEVVWGATREAQQRYGDNAVVRVRNTGD